ncbi:unnamed protein product [Phytomonas sp. EM1]|nr:unnamed protein product [Phytomonas sp. EM1]|eukprot:CCW65096.1 unnamed protein product [Phytomonas sp. isolate EM1]
MFRRCICSLIPYVEAKNLFFNELGKPLQQPTAPLPRVLKALGEHYAPLSGGETFVEAAMSHVIQLDRSDEDSKLIASWYRDASPSSGVGGRMVLELMRAYPHSVAVREFSCRCLANICQLSSPPHDENCLAESLVEEGSVEHALGTAAMAARLSGRGRCWVAMAILNLVCLSRTGVARAAVAGGESVLSDFIFTILEAGDGDRGADLLNLIQKKHPAEENGGASLAGSGREVCIALDATLGALTGVLAAEAPENAQGISYNYEKVNYGTVDAIVRTLVLSSALLCQIVRSDGNSDALFSQRCNVVNFPDLSPHQQTVIVMLLPLLHKAWMALCYICSHTENVPMVCESLYAASSANGVGESGDHVNPGEQDEGLMGVPSGSVPGERRITSRLSRVVEAARFLVNELEGLQAVGDAELLSLQRGLSQSVMECMGRLTAPRTDVPEDRLRVSATTASGAAVGEDGSDGISAVLPTPAVLGVMEVLVSGDLSRMALATAVRLHADLRPASQEGGTCSSPSDPSYLLPQDSDDFHLLIRSVSVLNHLAGTDDEFARSANTVAALQVMLRGALDGMNDVAWLYARGDGTRKGDLAELFQPATETGEESFGAGNKSDVERRPPNLKACLSEGREAQLRLFFMQQVVLVGQIYAVLSGVLQAPGGAHTIAELNTIDTVKAMQRCLHQVYAPAMMRGKERCGADLTTTTSEETDYPTAAVKANENDAPSAAGKPSGAESSVYHLMEFGDRLISHFEMVNQPSVSRAAPVQRNE